METRGHFFISGKQYILFVERGIFRNKLYLFEHKKDSCFLQPVPIRVTTSTPLETGGYWLEKLKRYLAKQRNKKRSQAGCSNPRNSA